VLVGRSDFETEDGGEQDGHSALWHFKCWPILRERSVSHLADVLSAFPGQFIVETNGIMLGFKPDFFRLLLPHHPYMRLTIAADSPERFQEIT
jgi:uncharacterized Fe-S cluster-containing radical SAM superfamily protein